MTEDCAENTTCLRCVISVSRRLVGPQRPQFPIGRHWKVAEFGHVSGANVPRKKEDKINTKHHRCYS